MSGTTSSRKGGHKLAPLSVLSSMFPLPPASPVTPLASPIPPLSGPPSIPLPNPPAKSRFSDHEAVLLLSSSSSAASRLSAEVTSPPTAPERRLGPPANALDDGPDPVLPTSEFDDPSNDVSQNDLNPPVQLTSDASVGHPPISNIPHPPPPNPTVDPMTLHRHIRSARSRSSSHKQALQNKSSSSRPSSPDIQSILTSTPRAKRSRSTSNLSSSSRSKSRTRSSNPSSTIRRVSEGTVPSAYRPPSDARVSRALSDRSWVEDEFTDVYRTRISRYDGLPNDSAEFLDEEATRQLERQLEAEDGSDSDSSLDLHTPLPDLMVRHGLLSPRSKLLAGGSRPESKASFASTSSVITKSGILKDQRDTPQRRSRHRDGRQLRGGLGLTTGLGWSDSEDEDAPSALTRRVSSLNLSRAPSISSIRSKASAPKKATSIARSLSSTSLFEENFGHPKSQPKARSSSRQSQTKSLRSRASGASATEAYTTSFHLPSRVSSPPTTPSNSSYRNIAVKGSRSSASLSASSRPSSYEHGDNIPDTSRSRHSQAEDTSSSSTISVPAPVTPKDELPPSSFSKPYSLSTPSKLPSTGIKQANPKSGIARPRALSSGSTLSEGFTTGPPPKDPLPPIPPMAPPTGPMPRTPRPLQLPLAQGRSSLSAVGGDRTSLPTQKMPASPPTPLSSPTTKTASAPPSTAMNRSGSGISRPKPRTGTGMVYRSSSFYRQTSPPLEGKSQVQPAVTPHPKPIPI